MAEHIDPTEGLDPQDMYRFWEEHIQAWQKSGATQAEYCREHNLKNSKWWYWRKRISKASDTDVQFVPLSFSSDKFSTPQISMITPNGYRIEFDSRVDFSKLRQLITTIRGL